MTLEGVIRTYGNHFTEQKVSNLLQSYRYQPELTRKLDSLTSIDLSLETIYEIVLWKLDRYPEFTPTLLRQVNDLATFTDLAGPNLSKAQNVLRSLLQTKGIQLPMASAILRFRNPIVFQIIDERAYRIACGEEPSYPSKPYRMTEGYLATSTKIYFSYLSKLHEIANHFELSFKKLDRILYQLDIELGNELGRP
jgi:hypothetical protein